MSCDQRMNAEPPPEWDAGQPEFKEDEPYYSNQGAAGTCVRHAVAKAIQREITGYTQNKIALHTMTLVQWLVNENPQFGADGCRPCDFDECKGTLVGQGGYIFDVAINIFATENKRSYHVAAVDLGDCLEGYEPGALHAMFCESYDSEGQSELRNSWGTSHEYITLPDESPAWRGCWYVQVTDFIWRRVEEDGGDVTYCEGGTWFTDDCEWPAF